MIDININTVIFRPNVHWNLALHVTSAQLRADHGSVMAVTRYHERFGDGSSHRATRGLLFQPSWLPSRSRLAALVLATVLHCVHHAGKAYSQF